MFVENGLSHSKDPQHDVVAIMAYRDIYAGEDWFVNYGKSLKFQ